MLIPGARITPNLQLIRPLGAGGMGAVWLAHHVGLSTTVVVKFVLAEFARDPAVLGRFRDEAAAASMVRSPHVVQILDHGVTVHGQPYIAMELLEGEDLGRRLGAIGWMPPRQVGTVVQQVARALGRAHERGVIHRDIKPANIFLSNVGSEGAFVKVLDFGVAKFVAGSSHDRTQTGTVIGTPSYMSPEQVLGRRDVTVKTDLWALGVVAFEALTGRRPFDGETVGAVAVAICHGPLPYPSQFRPDLPPELDRWFLRACSREPAQRFADALQMSAAFEQACGVPEPIMISPGTDDAPTVLLKDEAIPSKIAPTRRHGGVAAPTVSPLRRLPRTPPLAVIALLLGSAVVLGFVVAFVAAKIDFSVLIRSGPSDEERPTSTDGDEPVAKKKTGAKPPTAGASTAAPDISLSPPGGNASAPPPKAKPTVTTKVSGPGF